MEKGEESGMYHNIKRILIDDDQDSLILEIKLDAPTLGGDKASCHVGYYSCFYREIIINEAKELKLRFTETKKAFDPKQVYKNVKNPTKL